MSQRTEYLEEDWEPPRRRKDGGYHRKGRRTTRTYHRWFGPKDLYYFGLGLLVAAVTNFLTAALR